VWGRIASVLRQNFISNNFFLESFPLLGYFLSAGGGWLSKVRERFAKKERRVAKYCQGEVCKIRKAGG
jgi:hypothetical protein